MIVLGAEQTTDDEKPPVRMELLSFHRRPLFIFHDSYIYSEAEFTLGIVSLTAAAAF